MARLALAAALMLLAAGCALRPRYNDVVPAWKDAPAGAALHFELTQKPGGGPLAGVRVELGEGKTKVTRTTDATGVFDLPLDAKLAKDNPMLVVTLPAGVTGYEVKGHLMGLKEAVERGALFEAPPARPPAPPAPESGGVSDEVKPAEPPASEETPAPEAAPEAVDGGSEAVSM